MDEAHSQACWRRADGGAPAERLFTREGGDSPQDWSRDGHTLVFTDTTTSRDGIFEAIALMTNKDAGGVERADAHAIWMRTVK
jgi:hypothetical protein